MDILRFLGYVLLFAAVLFLSTILGTTGVVIFGGAILLAILWMLLQKLGQTGQKLDELLKKRDEHDVR